MIPRKKLNIIPFTNKMMLHITHFDNTFILSYNTFLTLNDEYDLDIMHVGMNGIMTEYQK